MNNLKGNLTLYICSSQDPALRRVSAPMPSVPEKFQPAIELEDPPAHPHRHQAKAAAGARRETGGLLEPQADVLDARLAQPQRRHRGRGGDRRVRQRRSVRQPEEAAARRPSGQSSSEAGTMSQLQH